MGMDRGQLILATFLIGLIAINTTLYVRVQNLEDRMEEIDEIQNRILSLNSSINQLGAELSGLKQVAKRPLVVVRIDDISDLAPRDAELFLIRYNMASGIPTSLGVIARLFGADEALVELVSSAMEQGSEVLVHGWEHEDLTKLSADEQEKNLLNARERLERALGINATMLAPPYLAYNNDTLTAMRRTGYDVISTDIYTQRPGPISEGIIGIPITVTMSTLVNGTWQVKSLDILTKEITLSIGFHGYAVILTHPQEFMKEGKLDKDVLAVYMALMERLRGSYSFTTIGELRKELRSP